MDLNPPVDTQKLFSIKKPLPFVEYFVGVLRRPPLVYVRHLDGRLVHFEVWIQISSLQIRS